MSATPSPRLRRRTLIAMLAICALGGLANANPRPLPYTYIYETLPKGEAEVELYTDLTPLRAINPNAAPAWYLASQFQTEIEYGLTDRLELGLYLTVAPAQSGWTDLPNLPEGTGVKQRLRYRFGEVGQWPIDLAVYGEVTENEREIELEGKVILQRRVGPLRFAANAWAEREYYFRANQVGEPATHNGVIFGNREWVLNPAAGVVFEKWAQVQPGIEYWMHAEHLDGGTWVIEPQHYLGPTVLLQFGKIWWSNGAYFRLNGLDTPAVGSGNPYGAFSFRTIVGIDL
jgi:hypothetical protein